jgi:thiol:disulfide interchange protein
MNNRFVLILIIVILGLGVVYFSLQQSTEPIQLQQLPNISESLPESLPESPSEHGDSHEVKTYQDALQIAKLQNKKIYLYFTASWCTWCKKFEAEVLSSDKVQKELDNYIFYKVDVDKEKNITSKYGVSSVPAHRIINSEEKTIKSGRGYKGEITFILWLKLVGQNN